MNSKLKQAYLQVSEKKPIQVVLRDVPEDGDGVRADLVELKGAVFDAAELAGSPKDWDVCGRIAELCRCGSKAQNAGVTAHNAAIERLECAQRIALDCRKLIDPDECINSETLETLLNGILDNISTALHAVAAL